LYIKNKKDLHYLDLNDIKNEHKDLLSFRPKPETSRATELTDIYKKSYEYIQEFPKFEPRESQKMMCDIVDKIFEED